MLSGVNDKGVFFTALALKITKLRIFNHFINKVWGTTALRSFGDSTLRGLHWPAHFLLTFIQLYTPGKV